MNTTDTMSFITLILDVKNDSKTDFLFFFSKWSKHLDLIHWIHFLYIRIKILFKKKKKKHELNIIFTI